MMELSTFENLLDRHGGDVARWPAAAREPAAALLAASTDARAMRDAMAEVEVVLRKPAALADPGAPARMAARATRHRQETPARRLALRAGWAAAAAVVLLFGVAFGALVPVGHDAGPAGPDRAVASALGDGGAADVE